jgi:hypothetical protein
MNVCLLWGLRIFKEKIQNLKSAFISVTCALGGRG